MDHPDVQGELRTDGPQDCGSFFLEALGPYRPEQLQLQWTAQARPVVEEVEHFIDTSWQRRRNQAAAQGLQLWDGPLCRLIAYQVQADRLSLTLGPTSFREFVGTNLHNVHLRYSHGSEVLANPVGLSAVVSAEERYLVLGKRSATVAYHAGRVHPIGGCLEPSGDGAAPDPFAGVLREIQEELGVATGALKDLTCLGMVRDKHIHQPEIMFDVAAGVGVEDIRRSLAGAAGRGEHADLVVLRDHPAAVVDFVERRLPELTPVALAGLLLHGLRRWGSGWFTSTRGYLRGVV